MTAQELRNKLNYNGMVKGIRKLAIDEKLETIEELAIMTELEICNLILEHYLIVYVESDEIGFINKDDVSIYNSLVKKVSR